MNNLQRYKQKKSFDKKITTKAGTLVQETFYNGSRQRQAYHLYVNFYDNTTSVVAEYPGYYLPDGTSITTTVDESGGDLTIVLENTIVDLPVFVVSVTPNYLGTYNTVPTYNVQSTEITNGWRIKFTPSAMPSNSTGNGLTFLLKIVEANNEQGLGNLDTSYYSKPSSNTNGVTFEEGTPAV